MDTSALLAVMDKDDEFHKEARALWERLTEQQVLRCAPPAEVGCRVGGAE